MAAPIRNTFGLTSIDTAWRACHGPGTHPLTARYSLGTAYNDRLAGLVYGEKTDVRTAIVRRLRVQFPSLSPQHLSTQLYRAGQFARCCDADRPLLRKLKKAGLSWRGVSDLLSLLVRRLEAPPVARRRIDARLTAVLDHCARGRLLPAQGVRELMAWRRGHPEYFVGRLTASTARHAVTRVIGALAGAERAWETLRRHDPGFTKGRTRRFRLGVVTARAELAGRST